MIDAVAEAAHLRFRPILITSFACIVGVVPLSLSSGAGTAGGISMGIGALGGIIAATVLRCS